MWCCDRYRDGVELEPSDRIKLTSPDSKTYQLTLDRIEEEDLGVYECKATSKAGVMSSKAKLIITGKQMHLNVMVSISMVSKVLHIA